MNPWVAAIWGLAGALCVEALWLHSHIRRSKHWSWRRPIPQGLDAYLISVVLRAGVGAGLASAAAGSGQVSGAIAAFGIGVAAPLIVQKLAQAVPLTGALDDKRENRIELEAERLAESRESLSESSVPRGVSTDVADILSARRDALVGQLRGADQHDEGRAAN